jgi:hypothetical protein
MGGDISIGIASMGSVRDNDQMYKYLVALLLFFPLIAGAAIHTVQITSPENETTWYPGNAPYIVIAKITPALTDKETAKLYVDGSPAITVLGNNTETLQFSLSALHPAQHTLAVKVGDEKNSMSPPIKVYMFLVRKKMKPT